MYRRMHGTEEDHPSIANSLYILAAGPKTPFPRAELYKTQGQHE